MEEQPTAKAQLITKSILSHRQKSETMKEPEKGTIKTNAKRFSQTAEAARKILSGKFWSSSSAK
jgi:hypothetical protein